MNGLARHFLEMALNNACANYRLLTACLALDHAAFHAPRTGFFPSLAATLNHILVVDRYYLAGLRGHAPGYEMFDDEMPCLQAATLMTAQAACDRALAEFCAGLDNSTIGATIRLRREAGRVDEERIQDVLAHLFQHQIHHRGQAHAMLSGTPVEPPQLDEYFLASEAAHRRADLASAGVLDLVP